MSDAELTDEYERLAHGPDPWTRFEKRIDEVIEELRRRFEARLKTGGPLTAEEAGVWRWRVGDYLVDHSMDPGRVAARQAAVTSIEKGKR